MVEGAAGGLHGLGTGQEPGAIPAAKAVPFLQQTGSRSENLEPVSERGEAVRPLQYVQLLLLGLAGRAKEDLAYRHGMHEFEARNYGRADDNVLY